MMSFMRILVTGAAGFIGANLAHRLKELGHEVFLVDRFSDYYSIAFKTARVQRYNLSDEIHTLDLNVPNTLNSFSEFEIETVVHLAGQPGIRVQYPGNLNYLNDNLNAFNNVISWALKNRVKKFLYASSSSVYEHASIKPFSESEILLPPSNLYPFSKWANEYLANSFKADNHMEISGLRFFSVYGPFGRPDMAIHRLIEAAFTGSPFSLNGNGEIERDFTYIDDVTSRILSLVSHHGPLDHVYNIGGGSSISMNSLIKVVEDKVGKAISIKRNPPVSADLQSTLANNSKINDLHGDKNWTSIDQGIRQTFDWYKNEERLKL